MGIKKGAEILINTLREFKEMGTSIVNCIRFKYESQYKKDI